MKIAAAPGAATRIGCLASRGRLACLDWSSRLHEMALPEEQSPKPRSEEGRAGGFEPRRRHRDYPDDLKANGGRRST